MCKKIKHLLIMPIIFLILSICMFKAFAADPSNTPAPDPTGQMKFCERWRLIVDLDGDGIKDLLLSECPQYFGKSGVNWTVYLNRQVDYSKVGEIFAHPMAISIEPDHDRNLNDVNKRYYARIWVYLRSSGSEGSFGYCRVGEKKVDDLMRLFIYPGDGGTDLGRAIYNATFNSSPIKFLQEYSLTDHDGTVHWYREK